MFTLSIPEKLRESSAETMLLDQHYKIKLLGLSWKPYLDHFYFYSKSDHEGVNTKGQLLSDAAKNFDPVGWLGPIVINFKILLRKL